MELEGQTDKEKNSIVVFAKATIIMKLTVMEMMLTRRT